MVLGVPIHKHFRVGSLTLEFAEVLAAMLKLVVP